jgi:predicted nucleic acid-binding Zn finger protein
MHFFNCHAITNIPNIRDEKKQGKVQVFVYAYPFRQALVIVLDYCKSNSKSYVSSVIKVSSVCCYHIIRFF